jgi:hypothetical protein
MIFASITFTQIKKSCETLFLKNIKCEATQAFGSKGLKLKHKFKGFIFRKQLVFNFKTKILCFCSEVSLS